MKTPGLSASYRVARLTDGSVKISEDYRKVVLYRRLCVALVYLRGFSAPVAVKTSPDVINTLGRSLAGAGWLLQPNGSLCIETWSNPM
jgi:hypothetical protein